jgi:hypothetical protein
MTQLDIDFSKRARSGDPETSHAAARNAVTFAHGHHALVLGALKLYGPQTIYELAERTKLSPVQVARRLPELAPMAYRTGEQRPSPTGNACGVWAAK